VTFFSVLLQIHIGNCLQKFDVVDLSLIKLLQNQQGCNCYAPQGPHYSSDDMIFHLLKYNKQIFAVFSI